VSVADLMSGMFAVQAILQGVLHREWTGEGQKIVVNMMQVQASCLAYHSTRYAVSGDLGQQRGNSHFGIVPYDVFRCSDGWFTVACANDSTWLRLEKALGLTHNPEWLTNAQRVADRQACAGTVQHALNALTVEAASEVFGRAGVPGGPVLTADQTLAHPTVQTVCIEHDVFGSVDLPGPAIQTRTTRTHHGAPPGLGHDRDSVLTDVGMLDRVDQLKARGAFGQ
jgi:succinate--hydroxymethylglutarate CoA-transferase